MNDQRPARIVYVSVFPALSAAHRTDFRRLFGREVEVIDVNPHGREVDDLVAVIEGLQPQAILLDPAGPPYTPAVRNMSERGHVVLEAIRADRDREPDWQKRPNVERRTVRAFVGFGIRDDRGQLQPVPDNAFRR